MAKEPRHVWYAEEKNFDGKWHPRLYYGEKPSVNITGVTGKANRVLHNLRKVPTSMHAVPLSDLFEFMNMRVLP